MIHVFLLFPIFKTYATLFDSLVSLKKELNFFFEMYRAVYSLKCIQLYTFQKKKLSSKASEQLFTI